MVAHPIDRALEGELSAIIAPELKAPLEVGHADERDLTPAAGCKMPCASWVEPAVGLPVC
jgi:hypothetical protein